MTLNMLATIFSILTEDNFDLTYLSDGIPWYLRVSLIIVILISGSIYYLTVMRPAFRNIKKTIEKMKKNRRR